MLKLRDEQRAAFAEMHAARQKRVEQYRRLKVGEEKKARLKSRSGAEQSAPVILFFHHHHDHLIILLILILYILLLLLLLLLFPSFIFSSLPHLHSSQLSRPLLSSL